MSSALVNIGSVFTGGSELSPAHAECMRELRAAEVERWRQMNDAQKSGRNRTMIAGLRHGLASLLRRH